MAMTSEERSQYPLCGAKKKNGEKCRAFAGQNTKHPGIGRCSYHLGNTESHQTHAAKVEAERKMVTMGTALSVTPAHALKALLQATAGHVAWLSEEVGNLASLDAPEAVSLTALYADERDRLVRIAKACLDSGIGKAEVEMAEETAKAQYNAVTAAMSQVGGLSNRQKKEFGVALRRELAMLVTDPDQQRRMLEGGSEPITPEEYQAKREGRTAGSVAEPVAA